MDIKIQEIFGKSKRNISEIKNKWEKNPKTMTNVVEGEKQNFKNKEIEDWNIVKNVMNREVRQGRSNTCILRVLE